MIKLKLKLKIQEINVMTTNSYEERQQAKRDRFQALADKAAGKSAAAAKQASDMARHIPFGQPVLIGHHSEKRDRAFRARIGGTMDKSIVEANKADYYEQKAAKLQDGKRCVIFIDELPCLDTPKAGFVHALGHFWNSWANWQP